MEQIETKQFSSQDQTKIELDSTPSVFDGIGSESPLGACSGCGNKYFFAVKLAV